MRNGVRRGTRAAALTLMLAMAASAAGPAVPPPEEPGPVAHAFDLYAGGIRVGEASLRAATGDGRYSIEGALETAGLVRAFFDASLVAHASGEIAGQAMLPDRFASTTVNGGEVDRVEVEYEHGAPRAVTSEPGDWRPPYALVPERQGRVADPLTGAISALAPRREGFCDRRIEMYDGKRRFALVLGAPEPDGERVRCEARYERVGGYKPKMMRPERRTIPLTLWFEAGTDGLYELVRARIPADWVDLYLVRRD